MCLIFNERYLHPIEEQLPGYSEYKNVKRVISTLEMFAHKLVQNSLCLMIDDKNMLQLKVDVNNRLGSLYTNSNQPFRALDSFQTAYRYNEDDVDSLFGVALLNQL